MTTPSNIPPEAIISKLNEVNGYSVNRRNNFVELGEQLDKLYHDIHNDLLGASAKTGEFYTYVKGIKDSHPKPSNLDVLKSELQALMDAEISDE